MSVSRATRMTGVSVSAALIGALAVSVGGLGVAVAANGGSLTLGQANSATAMTTLSDSRGTPLALKAGKGKPPLSVNSTKQVAKLNASLVGGSSASSLQTSGSAVSSHYAPSSGGAVTSIGTRVAATAKLKAGTYYATADASVLIFNASIHCELSVSDPAGSAAPYGHSGVEASTSDADGTVDTLTQTAAVVVKAGQRIGYWCETSDTANEAELTETSMTVFRIDHSAAGILTPSVAFAISKPRK